MSWLFFCCCAEKNERGFIVLQFQRGWGVYNGRRNTATGRGEIISSTANINQRVNQKCSETVGAQTQSPSRVMLFFQQGSSSKDSTKSTTEWGPSFQVHRPTGDISHSDHHTVLKIRLLLQGVNTGHGWQWLSQCWCLWDIIFVLFLIQESHIAQASLEVTM